MTKTYIESIFDVTDELSDRRERLEEIIEMWDQPGKDVFKSVVQTVLFVDQTRQLQCR